MKINYAKRVELLKNICMIFSSGPFTKDIYKRVHGVESQRALSWNGVLFELSAF